MNASRPLLSPLRLLAALLVSAVAFASGTGVAEAQNGVAAINPESGPAVEAADDIGPGHVGSDTGLFDDGTLGCCVAPRGVLDGLPACRSFSADTEVLMADGSKKPISQIEVGDEVLAADPETGESGARVVVATIPHNDQLLTLRTSAGEIVTTEDHLYWNQTDSEWQESQLLGLGDRLLAADGDVVVVEGLDWSTVHIDAAYDLDVAGFDTFYVGAGDEAVLVHNIECPWQLKTDDIYGNQILGGDVHKFDSSVLRELTPSQLRGLQTDLTASIANRTDNLLNPNAAAGHNDMSQIWLDHADRLLDEKRLLTQVERMLG